MNQIIFEKDHDENYHINFILSFFNLRANNNHNIEKTEYLSAKEIVGNIISPIVSNTAIVTGFTCLQIYTLLQKDNLSSFINCDLNLGIGLFDLFIPEEKRYVKDFKNLKMFL